VKHEGHRKQAAEAAARRSELAELIANTDMSLSAAARHLGLSQQRASQMWAIIRKDLGWQAV